MTMTVKVLSEHYRIAKLDNMSRETLEDNLEYSDEMYYKAYGYAAQKMTVIIERVTVIERQAEMIDEMLWPEKNLKAGDMMTEERITGSVMIAPPGYASDTIGRYNPVNGWVIPETIEIY